MAEMTFDGAFSDLKMKVASESAIQAIYPELVKLSDFAHTYNELDGRPGESVVIPVYDLSAASDWNDETNNYGSGQNEVGAANVTLDKRIIKSLAVTDRELMATGISWTRDATTAIAKTLGRSLNSYVMGLVNSTNCPLSAQFAVGTKAQPTVQKLYQIATENGLDVGDSVVVLNPKNYTDMLGVIDYAMYGGREAVVAGYCPGLFGFLKVVCSDRLADGVDGFIANRNSIGICSRYLEPLAGAYPVTFKTVDPDSGFSIGWRLFADLNTGIRKFSGEALVGAKVLMPNKIVRLING